MPGSPSLLMLCWVINENLCTPPSIPTLSRLTQYCYISGMYHAPKLPLACFHRAGVSINGLLSLTDALFDHITWNTNSEAKWKPAGPVTQITPDFHQCPLICISFDGYSEEKWIQNKCPLLRYCLLLIAV